MSKEFKIGTAIAVLLALIGWMYTSCESRKDREVTVTISEEQAIRAFYNSIYDVAPTLKEYTIGSEEYTSARKSYTNLINKARVVPLEENVKAQLYTIEKRLRTSDSL